MRRIRKADVQALRRRTQDSVQCYTQNEIAGTAQATGREPMHLQEWRWIKDGISGWNPFQDDGGGDGGIEDGANRPLARRRRRAGNERGRDHTFFLASLPGSTPSCLSLRYRWVRSRPVFSATRVMLPPSRPR